MPVSVKFSPTTAVGDHTESKGLSEREKQILGLAAAGLIDKEIAAELGISINTLRTYWSRIRNKYGRQTRVALSVAYVKGELDPSESKLEGASSGFYLPDTTDSETLRRAAIYYATGLQRMANTLRKVTRAGRVLGMWPRLAASAKNEADLIQHLCQLLVEEGGYKLVWVGLAQDDVRKSVEVAGSFGDPHGYLAKAKVNWGDNPRGRGPGGTAIRTGQTQVTQDFMAEAKMKPWRDDAHMIGIQASVVLPLKRDSTVLGFVAVYASEPDAFDDEEVKVLEMVTADFNHRLSALRTG